MSYKQEPPFAVQVELTEGCNLYCNFCGLQGIRTQKEKNFKFMTLNTATNIASELRKAEWTSRIEFAMHGEPTMNPQAVAIVRAFRNALPRNQLMLTSNGGGLLTDTEQIIAALFEAGLTVLALDDYKYVNIVPKVLQRMSRAQRKMVRHYPKDLTASPHRRWNEPVIIVIRDITHADAGTHATLNNHCGAAAPLDDSAQGKRCAKPFRELSIRWDGSVAICCNDWRGVFKCGNINKKSLDAIWNGPELQAARRYLYRGARVFRPCLGCNALSYRVGLLPDKKGKVKLPKPTRQDEWHIARAIAGKPYTAPVRREWEPITITKRK